MWGVCDIAWLTFLWTFYFPAVAPPFSRSAPRLRWSLIVCPRTEKLSKKRARRRCVFYGMLTNSYRVNAWMLGFRHRNFALPCVLRFFTLLSLLLAFIVAFIEGCRISTRLTRNFHVLYSFRAYYLHVFNSFYPVFIVCFLFPYLILQIYIVFIRS